MPAFDIDRDAIGEPALGGDDLAIGAVRVQREHAVAAEVENEQAAERGLVPEARVWTSCSAVTLANWMSLAHMAVASLPRAILGSSVLSNGRCLAVLSCLRDGAARVQAVDFGRAEPELLENLVDCVHRGPGRASQAPLAIAMHLNGTADRRGQLAACSFERNDDVIRPQLRIVDDFLRPTHGAERDMNAIEDFVPVRHRLRAEDFVENGGQLRHVLQSAWPDRRIADPSGGPTRPIAFATAANLSGVTIRTNQVSSDGAIHVQRRIRGMLSVVQPEELRLAQRGLNRMGLANRNLGPRSNVET